jgi:hypothetical protein
VTLRFGGGPEHIASKTGNPGDEPDCDSNRLQPFDLAKPLTVA